jgi:hypothetical protein
MPLRIDTNCLHPRKIDYQSIVTDRQPRDSIAAAPYRNHQIALSRKVHACDYIRRTYASRNNLWVPVDHGIK